LFLLTKKDEEYKKISIKWKGLVIRER